MMSKETKFYKKVILFVFEIVVGLLAGCISAALILPLCYSERGHFAIGAEWILIILVAYAGFTAINNYMFQSKERG